MSRLVAAAATAGALVAGGCAGFTASEVAWHADQPSSGTPSLFAYGAAGRDLTTVVMGNPFQVPKPALDKAVTDIMQVSNPYYPQTHFTTTPSANARRDYRVVTMFDPPLSLNPVRLCADPASLPRPVAGDGKRLMAISAFCVKDRAHSVVEASVPRAASPEDPRFHDLINRTTVALFPAQDRNRSDDDDSCDRVPC